MNEATLANSRIYTDIQGLKNLQFEASKNSADAKKEVAHQFEAILMQMVMSSMRNANKVFASDMFGTQQMDMYQDMFDKQLSLLMSNSNIGFAKMVEDSIDQKQGIVTETPISETDRMNLLANMEQDRPFIPTKTPEPIEQAAFVAPLEPPRDARIFHSKEEFVKRLWSTAKVAAQLIGGNPEILLAQAALETNWGQSILPKGPNQSSFNLFNIKSGDNWKKETTMVSTLEQRNGVLVKEKANFRSYGSFFESFMDYVNVLKQNTRYSDSLAQAAHPEKFVTGLQAAGYATDEKYAQKVMDVYNSSTFKDLVKKMD